MSVLSTVVAGLLGGVAMLKAAPVPPENTASALVPTYRQGEVFHESLSVIHKPCDQKETRVLLASLTTTVREVKPNGDVVFRLAVSNGTAHGSAYTLVKNRLGKPLRIAIEAECVSGQEINLLSFATQSLLLPDRPVKVGETWQTEVENPIAPGSTFTVKTTWLGTEAIHGKRHWKFLQSAGNLPLGEESALSAETVFWFDPRTHQVVLMKQRLSDSVAGKTEVLMDIKLSAMNTRVCQLPPR